MMQDIRSATGHGCSARVVGQGIQPARKFSDPGTSRRLLQGTRAFDPIYSNMQYAIENYYWLPTKHRITDALHLAK
jgi:hypothetical protein